MSAIRLGSFRLDEPIAQGGMGTVWRAVHEATGATAAVKTLLPGRALDPLTRGELEREIRAVAALDHPHIVGVYDRGTVPQLPDDVGSGQLVSGAPWLALEWMAGGTLRQWLGRAPWPWMRTALLQILDGLAHAHARGLIHRDIKPANVLVDGEGEAVKLTDFGIVHALDAGLPSETRAVGTPAYMPPEQVMGDLLRQGPWTDLYAVGCVAHSLASGGPVFEGSGPEIIAAHLGAVPPTLRAAVAVPVGFDAWISRLLEKHPQSRFTRAADAADALMSLGEATVQPTLAPATTVWHGTTGTWNTSLPGAPLPAPPAPSDRATLPLSAPSTPAPAPPQWIVQPPSQPSDWRPKTPVRSRRREVGIGLNLFGLRAIPLAGRQEERDRLWSALCEARESGRTRVVVLLGPAGVGKSRLARWLCERAHETGAARTLTALHSASPEAADGVGPMVLRHVRGFGLDRAALRAQIRDGLPWPKPLTELDLESLAELAMPSSPEDPPETRSTPFDRPEERYEVFGQMLARLGSRRPSIVWFDDAQWGLDSLRCARFLADGEERSAGPTLVVITLRDAALAERPAAQALVDELRALPTADTLEVGPLPAEDRGALIHNLVGLSGPLAQALEDRTGGNPLFAVHLISDWVERGVLVPDGGRFKLAEGVDVSLPEALGSVWAAPLSSLLEGRPESERVAVELAGILGSRVASGEWRAVCECVGASASPELLDRLALRRLLVATDEGFDWAHGMVREAVVGLAERSGRAKAHHRVCAAVLQGGDDPDRHARIGEHLFQAGDHAAATEPLLTAAARIEAAGHPIRAQRLWSRLERCIALAGDAVEPEFELRVGLERGEAYIGAGRRADGFAIYYAIEARATEMGRPVELAQALLGRGRRVGGGDPEEALALCERARTLLEPVEGLDPNVYYAALGGLARVHALAGRPAEGVRCAQAGIEFLTSRPDWTPTPRKLGIVLRSLGILQVMAGQLDEGEENFLAAREQFELADYPRGLARVLNGLGELARARGDFEDAADFYRQALERGDLLGRVWMWSPAINLALTLVQMGRAEDAADHADALVRDESLARDPFWVGLASLLVLPGCAARGDSELWDERWAYASRSVGKPSAEPDLGLSLTAAANGAEAAGWPQREAPLRALELEHYLLRDLPEEVRRVQDRLDVVGGLEG